MVEEREVVESGKRGIPITVERFPPIIIFLGRDWNARFQCLKVIADFI